MSKYLVTFCYTSYSYMEVEADTPEKACERARQCTYSDHGKIVDCTEVSE